MKKFLAALLAVVMVVSLFPATVFAAESECTLGADGHSKVLCDLIGVEYTKVDEKEGKCGQDGYTMYQCECGVYFADDIVDMPDHAHAVGAKPVTERVEPTCDAYGWAAVYVCEHCGEQYAEYKSEAEKDAAEDDDDAPAGAIVKLEHDFDESPDSYGNDCTAEKQICINCGNLVKNEEHNTKHNFKYSDPHAITTIPGSCAPGEATFFCQNEGCEGYDKVLVDMTGHDIGSLEPVDEEEPKDCKTPGVKAHYLCEECDAKFIIKDGELVPATDADLVIEVEHLDPYEILRYEPKCGEEGFITYKCDACKSKPWTVEFEAGPEHTTLEEVIEHNKKAAEDENDDIVEWYYREVETCEGGKTYYWQCQNPRCGSVELNEEFGYDEDDMCPEILDWTDPKTEGHEEYTVKVPATQNNPYSYTIVFCTNPDCEEAISGTPATIQHVEYEGEFYDLPVYLLLRDKNLKVSATGDVYEMTPEEKAQYTFIEVKKLKEVAVTATKNCTGSVHYYWHDLDQNQPATCTAKGQEKYVCENAKCRDSVLIETPAYGHTPDYFNDANMTGTTDSTRPYSCTQKCKLYCSVCKGTIKTYSSAPGHTKDPDDYQGYRAPNCQQAGGDIYGCLYCDGEYIANKVTYSYRNSYNSLEEALLAHTEVDVDNPTNERAGDCDTVGRVEYKCTADGCNRYFWVRDVEHTGQHMPDKSLVITEKDLEEKYNGEIPAGKVVFYEEANCLHGAGYSTYTCVNCGETIGAEKPLDHNIKSKSKKNPTCTEGGWIAYYYCLNECCWEENDDGEKVYIPYKRNTITYTDENGMLQTRYEYEAMDPADVFKSAKGHTHVKKGFAEATCTTAGYEYWLCSCGDDYVTEYAAPTGHEKASNTPVSDDPTCVKDGAIYYVCSNVWCTGDDGIAGNADDGIYTDEETEYIVVPALGHINKSGETIVDSCMDTETDRVCVRAVCDLGIKKTVPKSHKESDPRTIKATCTTPEYILTVCENGCGTQNKVEHVSDALGHKFAWGVEAGLDYIDAKVLADKTKEFFADPANKVSAYTAATYNENGSITFECARCNNEITMDVKVVGVGITFVVDNAVVPGANNVIENGELVRIMPVDGDVLAINIDIRAFETDVWGFNFDFAYDAKALDFLGYNYLLGDAFATFSVNNVVTDDVVYADINNDGYEEVAKITKGAKGVIKFAAYNEYSMDGKLTNTKISGINNVVTLYFQVTAAYEVENRGVIKTEFADRLNLSVSNVSVANTEKEIGSYGDAETLIITSLMDTNATGDAQVDKFNVIDLQNCIKIIKGQAEYEYKAAADVNKDGVVNLTDLDLMNEYLVGAIDADYIYNALNWTAPEGFVAG